MANQSYIAVNLALLGDGSSLTATIILDSTPFYTTNGPVSNFSPAPDSVSLVRIADPLGNPVPASAILTKNGKQVLITFPTAFTGYITVNFNLGYNV